MSSNRPLGRMLISQADNREIDIDINKVSLGSFYTTNSGWLNEPVRNFLLNALKEASGKVLDPFAGDGHLLEAVRNDLKLWEHVRATAGLDISGSWPHNDSLIEIPNPSGSLILTNPPYLANHSAKRKGISMLVDQYFQLSGQNNLYKVALANCLRSAEYVVAIIPETFLLSSFPKDRLRLAVVIEVGLFGDTDAPALVACFGPDKGAEAEVWTGEIYVGRLDEILAMRQSKSTNKNKIIFNDPSGPIGLRAVDGSDGNTPIEFLRSEQFGYSPKKVAVSSRLMTYISIPDLEEEKIDSLIRAANLELGKIREFSKDIILAPFKGNDRTGKRRRRLDYALARRILNYCAGKIS